MTDYELYYQLAERTENELIMLFFALAGMTMAIFIPLYRQMSTERKERRKFERELKESEDKAESDKLDRYIQREAQIIQVITQNTEAIAGLKSTLDTSGVSTTNALIRIHERVDAIAKNDEVLLREIGIIKAKLGFTAHPINMLQRGTDAEL